MGIHIHFQKESGIVTFSSLEFHVPLEVSKGCESPCPEEAENFAFSRVSTVDSDIPSSCERKTSLNLSHCREIGPSFESGPLGVHSSCDRKHRVPLTSLLLRENSS